MANQQDKQQQLSKINKLIGGMNTDVNPIDQPPGSYRFALNATNNREVGALSNERGTEVFGTLPAGWILIGSILVNDLPSDTKFVLFFSRALGFGPPDSMIQKMDFDGNPTTLLHDVANTTANKLNFTDRFPIEGEYKINATGEVSVYWTDDYNVPRYLNLTLIPSMPFASYELDLFPKIDTYPQVVLEKVRSSSGALRAGSYQLAVAYMTEDGAVTSYLDISNPVSITDEPEGNAHVATNAWGSFASNVFNGAEGGTPTSKAIDWTVSNLDLTYSYLVPCIVRTVGGAIDAIVLDRENIPQSGASVLISYTGMEQEIEEIISAVQIPKESYTKAKTVAQVDDVLYWGNLEKQKIDIGYQKYANNIKIFATQLNDNYAASASVDLTNYGTINMNFTKGAGVDGYDFSSFKSYKQGEVYAFYITWVLKDGSETVAYHIPGRGPLNTSYVDGPSKMETDLVTATTGYSIYDHPFASQITNWGVGMPLFHFHKWMFQYNSAAGRNFGFWQNASETYPTTSNGDFEGWNGDSTGTGAWSGSTLEGEKVRHHHFPLSDKRGSSGFNGTYPAFAHSSTYAEFAQNPVGIRVNDVPVPDFILDSCVAYKIYYLEKDTENMVNLGQTMIQGGRENGGEHKDDFGEHWLCMPNQWLDRYNASGGYFATPFFTTQPLDLMQTGGSIAAVDYIAFEPFMFNIGPGAGQNIYAKDSYGQDFHQTSEAHIANDWCQKDVEPLHGGTWGNRQVAVIRGKTRVPAGAIFGSVGGFTKPVDNEGSSELIAFELWDNVSFPNDFQSWGSAATDPYDTGWPTTNQLNYSWSPALNNHRRYIVNLMSFKQDVHLGWNKQRNFTYTGYSATIDSSLALTNGGYTDRPWDGSSAHGNGPVTLGGDVHIGYYCEARYRETARMDWDNSGTTIYEHIYAASTMSSGQTILSNAYINPDKESFHDYTLNNHMVEARVHAQWRHANDDSEAFYPALEPNHPAILDHETIAKKFPVLNADYLKNNNTRLLRAFDPDDDLQLFTDFPTRIIRSVKYNQSGLDDNFRVYLPEDYRDMPRHRGELWKLKSFNNIVIPHMERALYMTKGKETLQVTDASEAFLGTGDIFEKDPAEVLLTDTGHAGLGSQWAAVTSEFGYFFADKDAGKVFLLGDKQLEEISLYGMRKFFAENLSTGSQINALNPTIGPSNNKQWDNPIRGIGLHATYDPVLKRFILTKKDLRQTTALPVTNNNTIPTVYDEEKRWWYNNGNEVEIFTYWEPYIEWTVSYDPQIKTWVSFHSYAPTHYISALDAYYGYYGYSMKDGSSGTNYRLFKHGSGDPGTYYAGGFYNTLFPFMVDFIDNDGPDTVKSYKSIDYTTESIALDGSSFGPAGTLVMENPFDYISVYNSYQESGLISVTATNSRKADRMWFFNDFRDFADTSTGNLPSLTNPMTHLNGNYEVSTIGTMSVPGTQTIKYMPSINSAFLNLAKPWNERRRFVDKWMGVRLIRAHPASSDQNILVSLYTVNAHKKINYR